MHMKKKLTRMEMLTHDKDVQPEMLQHQLLTSMSSTYVFSENENGLGF